MINAWYRKLNFFTRSTAAVLPIADEGEAQNARGLTHWTGNNEPKSLVLALECFRKAADLGHAGAQGNLATMLASGHGTPRDADQAQAWFLRAARQGDAAAQFNLAVRFHRANMRGLTPDASEGRIQALTWFLLSAAQDYQKANEWCERLRVDMTREEVVESTRRASEFIPCKEGAASAKENVALI